MTGLAWRADSRAVTFEYNQRGHQAYRVIEIDARTGAARAIINEETPTFFEYSAKKYRFDLDDGAETVWMSERDGWNHLYLYDGATGRVKNQITKGPWLVRGVDRVDPAARQVWFRASGMYRGQGSVLHPLLSHQSRRHRAHDVHAGRRATTRCASRTTASSTSIATRASICRR